MAPRAWAIFGRQDVEGQAPQPHGQSYHGKIKDEEIHDSENGLKTGGQHAVVQDQTEAGRDDVINFVHLLAE
jgi:hypothetical protein